MRRLARPLLVLLAIVFLIEAWLWSHLEPVVEWIVARIPLRALKARLAAAIMSLPPAATLVVFVVPGAALFPFKILGLWLLAHQRWYAAALVLVLAKLVGLAITAFVFEATRPKLLQMAWFRWVYHQVLAWLAWAHRLVDPVKRRIKALLHMFGPKRAGRTLRLFWRIRRRMRAQRGAAAVPLRTDAPRAAPTVQSP
jgi:hypothetical protein